MQAPGEGVKARSEHDELSAAIVERGEDALLDPALARKVVNDDAGQHSAFPGEEQPACPRVA
jgi:hypothetical protein